MTIPKELICVLLILIGVGAIMAPFSIYVVVGWSAKRKDIMDGFDAKARLAYFKMFCGSEDTPSSDTAMAKFEELYSLWYGRRFFWIPGILLFLVSLIEITFVVLTVMHITGYTANPLFDLPLIAIGAIAGAYMWVTNDLISRARRLDFSPSDVQWGILRLVVAIPMGYAFAAVAAPAVGPFIAFALGAFPLATLTSMLAKLTDKNLGLGATAEEASDDLIKLQGINKAIVERLSNEDITTIPQVAYCDPVQLIMRSNLNFIFVTDCMNQALAWMYLEDDMNKIRRFGLRGAVEIKHCLDAYYDDDANPTRKRDHDLARAALPKIALAIKQELETLLGAFHEIAGDPFTVFLVRVWSGPEKGLALHDDVGIERPQSGPAKAANDGSSKPGVAAGTNLGILAYGSLIEDAGEEIEKLTAARITKDVETPFNVEFGRSTASRAGAPTLVPLESGRKVKAVVIVLKPEVGIEQAENILYRRETDQVGSEVPYPRTNPGDVRIDRLKDFRGVETVLYTKLPPNIEPLTPAELAKRAISSLSDKEVAKRGRDGISYLMSAKRNHIDTPLIAEYEAEVLRQAKATSLDQVLARHIQDI